MIKWTLQDKWDSFSMFPDSTIGSIVVNKKCG